ncbi:unnamed protein product [Leptidea sinapis]|jgi:hypothetical protein
MYQ